MHDAIILAGGKNTAALKRMTEEEYEALNSIAGKPMVAFVAAALVSSKNIGRVLIIGPRQELEKTSFPEQISILQSGATLLETIQIGIAAVGHSHKTLVATSDIPLLTTTAVDHFIEACTEKEADLYYPIVAKKIHNRQYPTNKRTYVELKEGTFTGGNIFMVNPDIVPRCLEFAEQVIEKRKSPFALCRLLGWGIVWRLLCRNLTITALEKRVSEILGITGNVIKTPYPEIGIDVDKPGDLELVQTLLGR
ncbi:MAG: nucleotidyltransferase family protein [Pelosinus sp.]|nr:nucleotidyltransferase family protein [Pelosinus sp.]